MFNKAFFVSGHKYILCHILLWMSENKIILHMILLEA